MFRLWGKEFKDNRMLRDTVICDDTDDTRTHKIFNALDQICYQFDLSKPIWLDSTISEFKLSGDTGDRGIKAGDQYMIRTFLIPCSFFR